MPKTTPWRKDPAGNVYRCHYNTEVSPHDGGYWVEYKHKEPKLAHTLYPFVVKVRGEVWHVRSKGAESAARLFWSDTFSTSPKRNEVTVEEVFIA